MSYNPDRSHFVPVESKTRGIELYLFTWIQLELQLIPDRVHSGSSSFHFSFRTEHSWMKLEMKSTFITAKIKIVCKMGSFMRVFKCTGAKITRFPWLQNYYFQKKWNCKSSGGDSAVKGFTIVPYIQGIAEIIRRVLNNFALKPFRTLGHIFAEPKDCCTIDRSMRWLRSIPCGDCEKVYLGQTMVKQNVSFAHVWRNIKDCF